VKPLTFGSLFAGIGGFDLGLERAGLVCKWQVEIDDFCNKVLAKHWPNVMRFQDVRQVGRKNLESVDVICGGFPCQDISDAGKRGGLDGARSGLWFEYYRIIREIRPRYALVENVSAITKRGLGTVLGNLAELRYDCEWYRLPAFAVGAPHQRNRMFILAYADSVRRTRRQVEADAKISLSSVARGSWSTEPPPVRMAYGLPSELDEADRRRRLKALGNAVVPQIAEALGLRILQLERSK
jgi:DNA (cytosine-5)-methyltransferase 1